MEMVVIRPQLEASTVCPSHAAILLFNDNATVLGTRVP